MKKQLAFMLGAHNYFNFLNEEEEMHDDDTSLLQEVCRLIEVKPACSLLVDG